MSDMSLEAFKSRVLPVKDKLYRFALRMVKDKEEAKDVVQEVMIKVWDKRDQMHTLNNMEAWCMRITRNVSIDKLKSKYYKKTNTLKDKFDIKEERNNPFDRTEMNDTMTRIHKFIGSLPEKQRAVFQLRDLEGYSYKEIGEILEIDINQVKVNLFRARKSIKENLLNINAYGL